MKTLRNLLPMLAALLAMPAIPDSSVPDRAAGLVDQYFQAMGGRDIWARAKSEYVLAFVSDPARPLPYTFELCWDLEEPRMVERARFQSRVQLRASDRNAGWTFGRAQDAGAGTVRAWTTEELQAAEGRWLGGFEVVTRGLAARDPSLSVHMGEGPWSEWLEIRHRSVPISRLLLDKDGAPRRYQRLADDTSLVFGPLADRGGFRFPLRGAFEIGATFEIVTIELQAAALQRSFAPPAGDHDGLLSCY